MIVIKLKLLKKMIKIKMKKKLIYIIILTKSQNWMIKKKKISMII